MALLGKLGCFSFSFLGSIFFFYNLFLYTSVITFWLFLLNVFQNAKAAPVTEMNSPDNVTVVTIRSVLG